QVAIQLEDVQLLVILELVGAVLGNLNYRAKYFRRAIANGQLKIVHHFTCSPIGWVGDASRGWMPQNARNRAGGPGIDSGRRGTGWAACPQARPPGARDA